MKKPHLFCHLIFLFFSFISKSQTLQGYTLAANSGTFVAISGGTSLPAIQADDATAFVSMPFAFKIGCNTYNSFAVSSNGYMLFAGSIGTNAYDNSSSNFSADAVIVAPLWDDLGGASGTAKYTTTGSAPNRIFTMEWLNWQWQYDAVGSQISYQVKLYESTNNIEFYYKTEFGILNDPSASVGIYNGAGYSTGAINMWLNNSSSAPLMNTAFTNTINTKPATGQVYSFTNNNLCSGSVGYIYAHKNYTLIHTVPS